MATPDVPGAAVEAGVDALWARVRNGPTRMADRFDAEAVVAAAAPHIRADERARVLDEVQAALRDEEAFVAWVRAQSLGAPNFYLAQTSRRTIADYLRDTLGAGGED